MKLTKKQTEELQKHGYDPCVKHLNLYPEDFMQDLNVWNQVWQCLGIDPSDVPWRSGVILAIVGVKIEQLLCDVEEE